MDYISTIIGAGAATSMTKIQFLEKEIEQWLVSPGRLIQLTAERYYRGDHDIKKRKREVIGRDGKLTEITNLPNNKQVDNQYAKAVDQKVNYLFAKPFTLETENIEFAKALNSYFDNKFRRKIKRLGRVAINQGIAWMHPHYNDKGELVFKVFEGSEVLPFWSDDEHTELDSAIRYYAVDGYEGTREFKIFKVEYYTKDGIERYVYDNKRLIPDVVPNATYLTVEVDGKPEGLNWERIPLIPFKFDDLETPLIRRVKCLQDGLNMIMSDYMNEMQEGPRNTILVLENYDGEDLGEFRHNLATYGAVKVSSQEGSRGDVRTLRVEVNSENYKLIYALLKEAIIENAKSIDAKIESRGQANEMNIKSMYAEMDIDANGTELEFQVGFDEVLFFITAHMANTGMGDFTSETIQIVFNRDMIINEAGAIEMCKNSTGVISRKTIVANHPWVKDVEKEIAQLDKERDEAMALMSPDPFDNGGEEDGEE